jgi:hypothetical protein
MQKRAAQAGRWEQLFFAVRQGIDSGCFQYVDRLEGPCSSGSSWPVPLTRAVIVQMQKEEKKRRLADC